MRTEQSFFRLAPPRGLATVCTLHCNTCVALDIRPCGLDVIPTFLSVIRSSPRRVPSLRSGNYVQGLRSLRDLTQHLTARADDSHAAPPHLSLAGRPCFHSWSGALRAQVRFLA